MMNQADNVNGRLRTLISEQREQAESLNQYLDEVRQAIATNAIEQLQKLVETGSPSLVRLESLQNQQNSLLEQHGFGTGPQALQDYLDSHASPELQQQGGALSEQLSRLRNSLLINDLLIRKNQHRIRQSIRLLNGRDGASNRATYSRTGLSDEHDTEKRRLATA
jgi:flagellar biosynthesis/type III secretory pathway chaperone